MAILLSTTGCISLIYSSPIRSLREKNNSDIRMVIIHYGSDHHHAFSGNEYQWMQDMDPSITALPQGNGNREIIKMLIYFILIIVQIALYFFQ